ncbi:hypothetical protein [Hyphomicrobium sp. CS1BSMeth3]|uniref:hypothetical protein n=1 Tax=Hyphomicrobium sp. CS1BSMeth3 TaxID=1892844 RepID=UPI0009304B9C|nr:hypothetical protein [Hyphomicrobium sp. CS1BSMeth3]
MSTKQKSTSNTTKDPYAPAIPGLTSAASGITSWMNNPANAQAYSGPRVAGMSDQTSAGLDALYDSAGAKQTEGFLSDTVGGKYLEQGNPYMEQLMSSIRANVMPSVNSRVSAAGMAPGSSVDQALVSRELTNATAQPLFQTYENERQRQMQAASQLPGVSQGIMGNMLSAGQAREGYAQRDIDAARQAWEEQRMAGLRPYAEALPYISQIGAAGGTGSETKTASVTPNPLQTALGVGMMGAQMATGMPPGLFGGGGMPGMASTGNVGNQVNAWWG